MKLKKILAALLALSMLGSFCTAFAVEGAPPEGQPAFSLRIEGVRRNLFYGQVPVQEGEVLLDAVCRVLSENQVDFTLSESELGRALLSADGDSAAMFGGWDGWYFIVNGDDSDVGMDRYLPLPGDEILVFFSDPFGDPPTLLPLVTATRARDGIVTLHVEAKVKVLQQDQPMSVRSVPVSGAALTVDDVQYRTDEAGAAVLSAADSAKERVSLQIEKADPAGRPLVVRLAPDYAVVLSGILSPAFSDVAENAWYTPFVNDAARLGVVNGYTDGTFRPAAQISRAETAAILYRMAGSPQVAASAVFSDVPAESWAAPAIAWCAENGVVNGFNGRFMPTEPVTRQDLATMLVRLSRNVLKKELSSAAPAPAFSDNDQIAVYAAEAVYILQKAGIVNGVGGAFRPLGGATRAEVCKMAMGLVAEE